MKKIAIALALVAAAFGGGCGVGNEGAYQSGSAKDGGMASEVSTPVGSSHCSNDLVPSLWGEGEYSIISLDSTPAGCAFVAQTTHTVGALQAGITAELAGRGYWVAGSVTAKGGERISYEGPGGLAVSALVRARRSDGDGSYASQVDLHWYDPARTKE